MKSYHKQLEESRSILENRLAEKCAELSNTNDDKEWFQLQTEINSIRQSIKANKQRIQFKGKYPYMIETPELIHQLTR